MKILVVLVAAFLVLSFVVSFVTYFTIWKK